MRLLKPRTSRLPSHARTVLDALRFESPERQPLTDLSDQDWRRTLRFCEQTQLTLALGVECGGDLPPAVRSEIDRNLANNAERWRRTQATYRELAFAFENAGLDHAVLKGFTHCPLFVRDPRHRSQGDLDLLLPPGQLQGALDVAGQLGYEPVTELDAHPIDHLPTMIRKTGWVWRGDRFDPDMPLSLELHFRVWDPSTELVAPRALDCLWERRVERQLEGLRFTALHPADTIAYSVLHSLRHLLRGDARVFHMYELAHLLHHHADDARFWDVWLDLHHPSLRVLEAICFSLAETWFGCRLPDAASEEIARLPLDVRRWLDVYPWSGIENLFRPNKDELWLHWSLIESRRDRVAMLRRRLVPEQLPGGFGVSHVPDSQVTLAMQARNAADYLKHVGSRVVHHARALPSVAWSALRWFAPKAVLDLELGPEYWKFLASEAFFDFGMFVFFFLYNLYLLKLGFRENFLGLMSSVMTTANIAGSILSVFAIQRFGMRRMLTIGFALTALFSAMRAMVLSGPLLLVIAAAAGLAFSVWPVALAPVIAGVTNEKSRARGFSFICSSGIAIGIFGSLAAARLPAWILRLHWASSDIASYRISLLIGCSIVLLSLWPLSRVKMGAMAAPTERKLHRPSPVLLRFLIAILVWNLATGVFNPFNSVYFARMGMPVERIGYVFSSSQLAQVLVILCAPFVFRRFGIVRGIWGMELATALAMAGLALAGGPLIAAAAYTAYMAFQYMSEPGMFTLLMDSVKDGERNSASALNFLVSFAGQAIAASAAGWMLARFGYPPVLAVGAAIAIAAAFLLRGLLRRTSPAGS
ncbi:MAG TPA: MFS transporter [Bryobacteraceae bacterium]|nr:MFS transporter [Bryobacteraceae bacterium]